MIFCLLIPCTVHSQEIKSGSVQYLQATNGFKDLKLGSITKLIPAYKLIYMDGNNKPDADSCYRYIYQDDSILKLGDGLMLDRVGLRTYNNQIVDIYLFFKSADGYKVLKNFIANYGACNDRPADFTYIWNTGDVSLSLHYEEGLDLGVAIFSSKKMKQLVQQNSIKMAATQKAIATSVSIAGN
jgi:hypothetical protein